MFNGQRKVGESWQVASFMLVGFAIAAYFKVSAEVYGMFTLGLMGKSLGFMWGNVKEHEANKGVPGVTP